MKNFYKALPLALYVVVILGFIAPMLISAKSAIAVTLGVISILTLPIIITTYIKFFFNRKGSKNA